MTDIVIPAIEIVDINLLKSDNENPNRMSEKQLEALQRNIEKFGFIIPIITNSEMLVADGEQRLWVAKKMGMKEVPIIKLPLNVVQRKIIRQVLNKLRGDHEDELDAAEFKRMLEIDDNALQELSNLTAIDISEFNNILDDIDLDKDIQEDGFNPEQSLAEPKYKVEHGDVWQLGQHRLMMGNATNKEDVDKLMNGQKADMCFTDPPYGMSLNTDWSSAKSRLDFAKEKNVLGGKKHNKVIGDHEDFKPELITSILNNFSYCKEIFLWGIDYYAELIPKRNEGTIFVWDKRLEESADRMYGSCFELCWSKAKHKRDIARIKWAGIFGTEKEFDHKRHHPTQKPILLSKWFVEKFSEKGKSIVDLFGGSGSTLIACEQLDRKCFMMEIDPTYCSVIIERFEEFTGQKAQKL